MLYSHDFHNFIYLFEVYRLVGVRYCVTCGPCVCSRYAVLMLRFLYRASGSCLCI